MGNDEISSNEPKLKKTFDLEERTAKFGEQIIKFAGKINLNPVTRSLIGQLVNAGTSVGANYCEANDAFSKKDFAHKISICRKEAKESKHWLRMIWGVQPGLLSEAKVLWQEAQELNLIFSSILRKTRTKL
ncbi:MAG: four helix bundle protein [bacterium]